MNQMYKYTMCGKIKAPISARLIYLVMLDMADDNGSVVIPQRKICNILNLAKSTVSRNLRKMQKHGYMEIKARYNEYGGQSPNEYIVK